MQPSSSKSDGVFILLRGGAGVNALLIATLSAVILCSALINGHWLTGLVGAAGFFIFANRLLTWFMASKTGVPSEEPDPALDPELAELLAKLETTRKQMVTNVSRRMETRLPAGLAFAVVGWAGLQFKAKSPGILELAVFCVMGAGIGWVWASARLSQSYRELYKQQVLPCLAASFGALTYRSAKDVDAQALSQRRIIPDYDRFTAEDEIVGDYHGACISIVELKLEREENNGYRDVFDGLLITIVLPRALVGTTTIIASSGPLATLIESFQHRDTPVKLEDPRFASRYQVFSDDQICARALLTPAFMERLLDLGDRAGFSPPTAIAQDNLLTFALPKASGENLFEPPALHQPAASRDTLTKLRADIGAVLSLADAVLDLDASTRTIPSGSAAPFIAQKVS